jgi:S1-C subfamily serine protease
MRRGDLLHEINEKPVETIEEAISAISSIKSSGSITIIRSGRRISLRFRL